ncbi:hypothetical protein PM082_021250 [Marasmius tenuissimus]|nr:hypothetical protein PM082_021250 [Marasmius tenuissimus]
MGFMLLFQHANPGFDSQKKVSKKNRERRSPKKENQPRPLSRCRRRPPGSRVAASTTPHVHCRPCTFITMAYCWHDSHILSKTRRRRSR